MVFVHTLSTCRNISSQVFTNDQLGVAVTLLHKHVLKAHYICVLQKGNAAFWQFILVCLQLLFVNYDILETLEV